MACARVVELVGLPECRYALSQATAYLALAPKSNTAGDVARSRAGGRSRARDGATARGPARRQLPRRAASSAAASATATRTTRPGPSWPTITCRAELAGSRFYEPGEHGLEAKLAERVRELRRLRGRTPGA